MNNQMNNQNVQQQQKNDPFAGLTLNSFPNKQNNTNNNTNNNPFNFI